MTRHFTSQTIVAEAIKADPGVIDRLIEISPTFRKLQNPLLRKVMARLVTLGDAARIASVPLETILAAVSGAPSPPSADKVSGSRSGATETRPPWMDHVDVARAPVLDVRMLLARGGEPLGDIMRAAAPVPVGGALVIEAPFDPAPLRRVLQNKGFVSHARELAAEHWRIIFYRDKRLADNAPESAGGCAPRTRIWREADWVHIDVRDLPPPEPMVRVLELLERDDTGSRVIVHHEREPIYLYPELAERGWTCKIVPGEDGEVRLWLEREAE